MPRKDQYLKRRITRSIHNSKLVTKLINKIMLDGKRGTAQKNSLFCFRLS